MATKRAQHLNPIEALERRVHHLEYLLDAQGIRPRTIEQVTRHMAKHGHGQFTAPELCKVAKKQFNLTFKPTSVSAILCRLVREGSLRKVATPIQAFHTYEVVR